MDNLEEVEDQPRWMEPGGQSGNPHRQAQLDYAYSRLVSSLRNSLSEDQLLVVLARAGLLDGRAWGFAEIARILGIQRPLATGVFRDAAEIISSSPGIRAAWGRYAEAILP